MSDPSIRQKAIELATQLLRTNPAGAESVYGFAHAPQLLRPDKTVEVEIEKAWPIGDLLWETYDKESGAGTGLLPAAITADGRVVRLMPSYNHTIVKMRPNYRLCESLDPPLLGGSDAWQKVLSRLEEAVRSGTKPSGEPSVPVAATPRAAKRDNLRESRTRAALTKQRYEMQRLIQVWGVSHPSAKKAIKKYERMGGVIADEDLHR